MGCRQTKNEVPQEKGKIEELTVGIVDNGLVQVDPRLPLDARQVFKLKQSWKGIKRKIEETGVEMFVR